MESITNQMSTILSKRGLRIQMNSDFRFLVLDGEIKKKK
jgi:hypothetical protein